MSPKHKEAFAAFEARVKEYVAMREGIEGKMPKLSKDATPEEIEAHKTAFQNAVRDARASARQGELFVPVLAAHIREVIKSETPTEVKQEVRETVTESEVKAVPVRVNYPYPESEELLEMPPDAPAPTAAVAEAGEVPLRRAQHAVGGQGERAHHRFHARRSAVDTSLNPE